MKIPLKHLKEHETKREVLIKFLGVLIIFISYFIYVSLKFGVKEGFLVAWLTWSFFVLCTPIADAGLLLDFPLRLITGIRMLYSEIGVWIIAISLNIYNLLFNPEIYHKTLLLHLLYYILTNPWPYWLIIILSCIGTFMSIYFGDELLDVVFHKERAKYFKHKLKYEIIVFLALFSLVLTLYKFLLLKLNVHLI